MNELTAFLRAIADEPDDDAHRLVFADWLDDHDRPARAEFIRLQVELARLDPSADGYAAKVAKMRRCGILTRPGTVPFFDHVPNDGCRIAFRRGLIEVIHTGHNATIDAAEFDLLPLRALRTDSKNVEAFRRIAKLRELELRGGEMSPERLLELFGPGGPFRELEQLCLPDLCRADLKAGVIPRFDLPRLRDFFLSTDAFYDMGRPANEDGGGDDDDFYTSPRPWNGLPEQLVANALPGPASPLERFVWHSEDDCDFFSDEDWNWRGPAMEALVARLKGRPLKQVEVAVDYDDHESGSEGVIAAPYAQNALDLSDTLECVTLDDGDLARVAGPAGRLRSLRVYGFAGFADPLFSLLRQPVCSALESLDVEARGGWLHSDRVARPEITFAALKSLHLGGPLEVFADCHFPELLSLAGDHTVADLLERTWPKLQRLTVRVDKPRDLLPLARSGRLPNLTTLTVHGYFNAEDADFSFLAKCPHMPHLSLVVFPGYPADRSYVVGHGHLVPVRPDVMAEEPPPWSHYRLTAVF